MTILHKGIRRKTTDVLDDYGQAQYLQNVRLKRVGEIGRRAGLGKSTMAQLAGPVQFMIGAWSDEPFIVNGTGGDVTGNEDPLPLWTGATIRIPGGGAGQPAAPVINSLIFSPGSGTTQYTAIGVVTFTANVTYDGLSGPLIYTYSFLFTPGPVTPPGGVQPNPASFDLSGAPIDGNYVGSLTVSTTANPLLFDNIPFSYATLP